MEALHRERRVRAQKDGKPRDLDGDGKTTDADRVITPTDVVKTPRRPDCSCDPFTLQ